MWTAKSSEARPLRRRRKEHGVSLLEMCIVVALISLMALMMERTMDQANKASKQADAVRRLSDKGQRAIYRMREIVSESRRLFDGDTVGMGYLSALDLSRDPMLPSVRLPVADPTTQNLEVDESGSPLTGNALLFVRDSDPAPVVANSITGKKLLIDTYRFVCIYPGSTTTNVMPGINGAGNNSRDLVIWRSVIYPSYQQLLAIQDPVERQSVIRDLYVRYGYDAAWDSAGEVASSFYPFDSLGSISAIPEVDVQIDEDVAVSERGLLVYAKIQLADSTMTDRRRRAVFSADDPATWTPNGIEFKVVGASGARRIWMRLVVETASSIGQVVVQPFSLIASARVY